MSFQSAVGYAGDLLSTDAYGLIAREARSTLVDVRTQAEWAYVGTPNLRSLGKAPLFLEWQSYPSMQIDPGFSERLSTMLDAQGVSRDAPVLFICRSGARSRNAAIAMTRHGWKQCYNVSDGFEGALDPLGHRSAVSGWKAAGLPWTQT